jgi:hypothetical protein
MSEGKWLENSSIAAQIAKLITQKLLLHLLFASSLDKARPVQRRLATILDRSTKSQQGHFCFGTRHAPHPPVPEITEIVGVFGGRKRKRYLH